MAFEETELRLGLPGNTVAVAAGGDQNINGGIEGSGRKRGYSETLQVDLKLNLSSKEISQKDKTLPPSSTTDPLPKPPPKYVNEHYFFNFFFPLIFFFLTNIIKKKNWVLFLSTSGLLGSFCICNYYGD